MMESNWDTTCKEAVDFEYNFYYHNSGFGGLVVSMLASGTQVRGFKPGRSPRIFRAKKSTAVGPMS
jgi:hypothetical protein